MGLVGSDRYGGQSAHLLSAERRNFVGERSQIANLRHMGVESEDGWGGEGGFDVAQICNLLLREGGRLR
jgi:hypothetical protein